jgi:hypothetical protein
MLVVREKIRFKERLTGAAATRKKHLEGLNYELLLTHPLGPGEVHVFVKPVVHFPREP